jgi:hypothetical protein
MVVIVVEKKILMVFILAQVFLEEVKKGVDNPGDFLTGHSCRQELGQLLLAAKPEEGLKGLAVDLFGQAEAHFSGIKVHGRRRNSGEDVKGLVVIVDNFPANRP